MTVEQLFSNGSRMSEGSLTMAIVIQVMLVVGCGLSCLYENRASVHAARNEAHAPEEKSGKK